MNPDVNKDTSDVDEGGHVESINALM